MQPLHPQARRALLASFAGYAADGFDMLILAFVLPAITVDLKLTSVQSGSLVTWTLAGTLLGGMGFGYLADRFGRVQTLMWSVLLFALFTGLCATARGYWSLVAFRLIGGLGLGGEFGIGMTLAAETWPASIRARVSSIVALGWQAGVLAAALIVPPLLPVIGWRGVFMLGACPAVIAFLVRRVTSEPEIFVRHSQRPGTPSPWKGLVESARITRISLAVWGMCSIQNFGYYGVMIWLPTYVSRKLDLSLTKSSLWTIATVSGMAGGIWAFGQLADRVGRRPAFLLFQFGAAVAVVLFSLASTPTMLLLAGINLGVFVNGMLGGYGTLISELYPTASRATAQNTLFNLGRAVGGFGPLVVGAVSAHHSFLLVVIMFSVLYLIDMAILVLLIPESRGTPLL